MKLSIRFLSTVMVLSILLLNFHEMSAGNDIYQVKSNSASNVEFPTTNYGIFGMDVANNKGGLFWPRNSGNQYIFAAGFWFGTQKYVAGESGGSYNKLVAVSYNPNAGNSWMTPSKSGNAEYEPVYSSTDYNKSTGEPLVSGDAANWPVWKTNSSRLNCGIYVENDNSRNTASNSYGPAILSDEDIFSVYNDSDLDRYDGGSALRESMGYPIGLEIEETVYSWSNFILENSIIIKYNVKNVSGDTLYDCFFAPVIDADLVANGNSSSAGASNDRIMFYHDDPSQNLVICWSEQSKGDEDGDLGIMGVSMILSPETDDYRYIKEQGSLLNYSDQIGVHTFRNWQIQNDIKEDAERYSFFTNGMLESGAEAGDNRIGISSGLFNMLPGENAEFAILITFSDFKLLTTPSLDAAPDKMDFSDVITNVKDVRKDFYENIVSPLGVEDETISNSGRLELYPNPASDFAVLNLADFGQVNSVKVYSLHGELVYSLNSQIPQDELRIECSNLPAGSYFVEVRAGSRTVSKLLNIIR